jgi:hypothetical protein
MDRPRLSTTCSATPCHNLVSSKILQAAPKALRDKTLANTEPSAVAPDVTVNFDDNADDTT